MITSLNDKKQGEWGSRGREHTIKNGWKHQLLSRSINDHNFGRYTIFGMYMYVICRKICYLTDNSMHNMYLIYQIST
jgi:hypothetical protein